MPRVIYTKEQKTEIIKIAKEIGAAAAAKENNVSYPTVLRWMKNSSEAVKIKPKNTLTSIDAQIKSCEEEIADLTKELNSKKATLKSLRKAREKAEKAEKAAREAAEAEKIVKEILKSGKSMEEVMTLLSE